MSPCLPRAALPVALIASALAAGCAPPGIRQPSSAHLTADAAPAFAGPPLQPVTQPFLPRPPRPSAQDETYSVVVNKVRVHDLLFALARDARLNVDIHPGIDGEVTLNAIDQTLPQLLRRIARQVEMRFELDGPNLVVTPDTPFLRNYAVDYVNMSRDTTGSLAVATQLVASVTGNATAAPGSGNNSSTRIENKAQHRFWETLIQNIRDILRETDRIVPEVSPPAPAHSVEAGAVPAPASGAAAAPSTAAPGRPRRSAPEESAAPPPHPIPRSIFREAALVIAHPETGTLGVRATSRQHEKVQEFLDRVLASARRQVMIEATLVEV
ncbi:MAG TPA: type II and III secretion system protein, partial [Azospira sp.]|nr:type II and III secretion system protein [Azospira sp.]